VEEYFDLQRSTSIAQVAPKSGGHQVTEGNGLIRMDDTDEQSRPIREAEAVEHVAGICFKHGPPRQVGVELEWLLHDMHDPARPVAPDRWAEAYAGAARQPLTGRLTQEPGGQWELSSLPASSLEECLTDADLDAARLEAAAAAAGLHLAGYGTDPHLLPRRTLDLPRYAAMEEFFDRSGRWGRVMMCSTASVQVNLDAGLEGAGPLGYRERWELLHRLSPFLIAAFANSPLLGGKPSGWRSTRQAVWSRLDPGRTRAPRPIGSDGDLRAGWAAYALDAELMCVRRPSGSWSAPRGVTFRDWLRSNRPDAPTIADLEYHLSTLFPPVRPRGHLELRVIDAQQGDDWKVPLALVMALLDDPVAADGARAALESGAAKADSTNTSTNRGTNTGTNTGTGKGTDYGPGESRWLRAAQLGLADPELRAVAEACFGLAVDALPRLGASSRLIAAVTAFAERYALRGRCPADDQLDALAAADAQNAHNALVGPPGRSGKADHPAHRYAPSRIEEESWH
jgi:glutamate--cysteine ligase